MTTVSFITPLIPLQPIEQSGVQSLQDRQIGAIGGNTATKSSGDFSSFLQDAINQVEGLQEQAKVAGYGLVTGDVEDFHTAVIAMEKASLAISLTTEVRNKVIEAYHEIMRMQM